MSSTTIKIKSSTTAGKIPAPGDLATAELAINLVDQKLYSKDAADTVFEIGKASVGQGGDPPTDSNEIGDLFWDGDVLLVWNGTDWEVVGGVTSVNGETGEVVLTLNDLDDVAVDGATDQQVLTYDFAQRQWVPASPATLEVNVDLDYTSASDKGTVTNTAGDDAVIPLAVAEPPAAGLFTGEEKAKLAGIADGATADNGLWEEDSGRLYPKTLANRLGLGTDSPSSSLFIRSEDSTGLRVQFPNLQDTDTNKAIRVHNGGISSTTFSVSARGQGFFEGDVGIGLEDPQQKLHVNGTVRASNFDLENLQPLP